MAQHGYSWKAGAEERLYKEIARLKRENESLKAQLVAISPPDDNYGKGVPETPYADSRNKFLTEAKKQGYNNVREYIEAMATKYSVDVEDARQTFLACGYEDWDTGFIETLMEISEGV